jgi:hypothetical protein
MIGIDFILYSQNILFFLKDIFGDKNVLNDNKNNKNSTKCWQVESYTILEKCSKCDTFSRNSLLACKPTGYREIIQCTKFGHVSRSCAVPTSILVRNYWTFQFVCLIITAIFSLFVIRRKRFLDYQATERVRQQLLGS